MKLNGIEKGDKDLKHFTFDDEDYVVRGGVYYYKVNYGKNPLEGEYGEEETSYVQCDKVITLGGKKPRPIGKKQDVEQKVAVKPEPEPKPESEPEQKTTKRGRPVKVVKTQPSSETISVQMGGDLPRISTYEYLVLEMKVNDAEELQVALNERGAEGWELCGFDTNKGTLFGSIRVVAIFKRKRG